MATWRCPHCATLQVEAPVCFLCNRSATSCGTCVNFRSSLVGGVGYCALDRRREPLTGAEQRPCWTASAEAPTDGLLDAPALPQPGPTARVVPAVPVRPPPPRMGGLIELQPPAGGGEGGGPPVSGR